MPINPGGMKALVDTHSDPGMAAIANPQMAMDDDMDEDDGGEEDQEAPAADPLARGNELLGQWGELGEALKEAGGEIVDKAHKVGAELLLAKIPEDAVDEVHDDLDRMPEDIQHALAKNVAGLSPEDCAAVAAALIDGHDGDTEDADQKLVCTYLQQIAAYAKEEIDPADYADEEDEEDDDDAGDGSDTDDGGDAPADGGAGDGNPY